MSKERLNCEDICPNHYSSWEEGTCMECCEIYNMGECPVVYVNDLEKQIADIETKLSESENTIANLSVKVRKEAKNSLDNFKRIKELETKLVESEKQVEFYKERYSDVTTSAYGSNFIAKKIKSRLEEEIREIKQQLAEKEKEIEGLKNNNYLLKDYIVDYFVSQTNEPMPIPKFVTDKDKISFAVEQLEKVKEKFSYRYNSQVFISCESLLGFIDNQIKEVKKEME